MRIAIYHNLTSGGAKRMLLELTRRLVTHHEVTVFTLSSANHEFSDLRPFVKDYQILEFERSKLLESPFGRLNQMIRTNELKRIQAVEKSIAHKIDSGNFDLVWVQPCQIQNSPSILRHIQRTPTIFICQEPLRILYESMPERPYDQKEKFHRSLLDSFDPLPKIFFQKLKDNDRTNIQAAKKVLVNSNFMQQSVRTAYPVEPEVNYPGVDIEFFRPMDLPKENFILSVGSLTPLKGYDFLVRSLGLVSEEIRPPLRIASNFSNPPEKEYLTQLAEEHHIRLIFESNITDQNLVELYNQALMTVYAPVREPFGLVAIESMACGTPVIGVNEGGLRETIKSGKTGFLLERDEEKFARAITTLLENNDMRKAMGDNGREEVERNWNWQKAAQTLETHFTNAINSN